MKSYFILDCDKQQKIADSLYGYYVGITSHNKPKEFWTHLTRQQIKDYFAIPNIEIKAPRYKWVVIEYRTTDTPEASQHERFEGFDAQIIQHEIDHLNGITIHDRTIEWQQNKEKN